jgi:hypothetical protein
VCVPTVIPLKGNDATPALTGLVPIFESPTKNATEPVGIPPVEELRFAVNVTGFPKVDGLLLETSRTVVTGLLFTTWLSGDELAASLFASPRYAATIECVPELRLEVVNEATELAFKLPLPISVDPSMKFTVPVGVVPVAEATLALKVTGCRYAAGFADEESVTLVPSVTCRVVGKPIVCNWPV